ncbi:hypothetical protein [Crocinitomix catalasitica]|uniref:hypothetical protein n=1 Tax=Crocinitomix catalasitica TaxID=184607 RepID=UPI0012F9793B|nr:hypothetical protein [Crocinitomix catalasitica]
MKYPSFNVKEFLVPEFTLDSGKMIRFWVQIVPEKENQTDGYWGVKKIFEIIENYNSQNLGVKIHLCPSKLKMSLFDFIKPIKVGEYLEKVFGLKSSKIKNDLNSFNIKPEYTLRKMGFAHQKLFSIICGIERNDIIAFDFYGFAPDTEIKLIKYIHTKLDEGKSLLAFDNLGYKEENFDTLNIENLIIKRI